MTREEKCRLAIDKGYSYNPDTGKIFGIRGSEITSLDKDGYIRIGLFHEGKYYNLRGHQFAYFFTHGVITDLIDHINRVRNDNRIINLIESTDQKNKWNNNGKNYYWNKEANKWVAHIRINGKKHYLGSFNKEDEDLAKQIVIKAKENRFLNNGK